MSLNNVNKRRREFRNMNQNQQTKKNSTTVSMFESNEYFEIDFTNPVKRMEFDMQRKRQQMKELANVSDSS